MNNNNIKNPFIGLRTYEEVDAIFFRGRKSSTSDLYNMISDNDVVVLHAESGEGKSSLLNAGLFPMLRDERFFPIKISFTEEDYALENPDFDKIVYQRIIESINQINCDSATTHLFRNAPSLDGKVSLLPIDGGDNILSGNEQLRQCAWWLLRNYTLNAYGAPLIPVLVFDQFEEVFTRPKSNIWTEDFFIWLSTTLNDTVPQNVINIVREVIGETEDFPKIRTEKKFKALFALRTEYMGELDYWGIQRHHISVLKNSRYCLKPLTEQEADEVLELQPVFTPQIRNQIKEAIRSSHGSKRLQLNLPAIPAMLLSVVSTTATNNIAQNGQAFDNVTAISGTDLSSDLFTNIIDQFYQKEIASANIPRKVINHIESVLVDDKGKRVRIKADSKELRKSDFEGKYKPILEQMRLIKCTQINGDEYVELTHDALAKVIANKRIKQADYIAKVKTLGLYILGGITFLLSILFACFYIDAIANYTQKFIVTLPVVGRVVINLFFIRAWIIITAASFSLYIHKKKKRLKIFMDGLLYFIVTYIGFINFFSIREIPLREYSFRVTRQFVESIDCHWFLTTCNCLSLALMLIVGRYLTCSKKILFKIFGILLMAIPILVTAAFYKLIISIAIICVVIFILSPCIFIKDRNSGWLLLMASCLMFINSLVVNGRDVIDTSIFMGIWLAILGIGYLFFKKENKFIHQIGLLKSGNLKQKFPAIRQAFNLYIIVILLIASYYIGLVMDPISSLVGMALICPILSVCTLKLFYKGNSSKNRVSLFVQVLIIEACVTLIWVSQFSFSHLLIVIGVILTLIVVEVLLSLFNKVPLKFNHKINRIFSYIASTLFAVLVGAYFLLGFNYFTTDDFQRMNGKNLVIRMYRSTPHGDLKLQLIKDKSGKIGIRDRKGNIVISPMYDDIYGYDHSFDDIYSDFVTSSNDFNIIFMSNGYPIKWNIFDHLHERNVLTDEFCYHSRGKGYEYCSSITPSKRELSIFLGAERLRENDDSYIRHAENLIIEDITSSINFSRGIRNQKAIQSFNPNDTIHLKLLNDVNYTQLPWEILPFTSKRFKERFYNKILPNTNLVKTYSDSTDKVEYVLCKNFYKGLEDYRGAHKLLNKLSLDSDERLPENLSYRIGDLCAYIAKDELLSGNYEESRNICENSYNNYPFSDPILPIQIASTILNGNYREANSLLDINRDKLIRINNGLETPNPSLENAWYFLQYDLCINIVEKLLQLTKQYGVDVPNWDYINQGTKQHKQLSKFNEFPDYDMIQVNPVKVFDEVLRFVKWDDGWNCERIYGYSYFVTNDTISSPLLSTWCYGGGENDFNIYPFLTVDYSSHKRRFVKAHDTGSLLMTKFQPWEFIGDEYNHAWTFHEGLAAVEINGKIGFINTNGEIVISPQFKSPYKVGITLGSKTFNSYSSKGYKMPHFNNGGCPVYDNDGKLIWIDKSGKKYDSHPVN